MGRHAPASRAMLNPPAAPDRIERWEATMGFPLPPALRALYLLHDGSRGYDQDQFGHHPHVEGPLPAPADDASRTWEALWAAALFLPGPGIHTRFAWFPLDEVMMQHPVHQGIREKYNRLIPFAADTLDSSMSGFFLDPQDGQVGAWPGPRRTRRFPRLGPLPHRYCRGRPHPGRSGARHRRTSQRCWSLASGPTGRANYERQSLRSLQSGARPIPRL